MIHQRSAKCFKPVVTRTESNLDGFSYTGHLVVIEEAMPYYLEIGFQAGLIATEYGNVKFANEIASRSSCFQVPSSEITLSF
jgi:hypothetical protein